MAKSDNFLIIFSLLASSSFVLSSILAGGVALAGHFMRVIRHWGIRGLWVSALDMSIKRVPFGSIGRQASAA